MDATTVAVEADDALDDALARLRAAGAGRAPVNLVIPAGSSLFLTAAEFGALKEAVDRGRLAVTVRTTDPLRLQLARTFGLDAAPAEAPPRAAPAPRAPTAPRQAPSEDVVPAAVSTPSPVATTAEAATAVAAPPPPGPGEPTPGAASRDAPETAAVSTAEPSIAPPPRHDQAATSVAADAATTPSDEDGAAFDWPAPPPQPMPPPAPVRRLSLGTLLRLPRLRVGPSTAPPRPPEGGDAPAAAEGPTPAVDVPVPSDDRAEAERWRAWRERLSPRSLPGLAALVIAGVVLAAVGVVLLLPRAEVAVVLKRQPVRAELLYDVVAPGAPAGDGAPLAVVAKPVTLPVVFEESIPTTGTRTEPNGTAAGAIRLANPLPEKVTVEAGTVVTTEEGVEFALLQDVEVPAADPATGRSGMAVGTLRAVRPGASGNVGPGEIGGRLPNGVYYMNRDGPTTGGGERTIRTVAAEDLETLRARAEAAVPELAAAAFEQELPAGSVALPASFAVGEGTDEFDHTEGDDADTLRLRAVRQVTALTYEPAAVLAQAKDELRDRLRAQAPEGYEVDLDTLRAVQTEPVGERDGRARFRLVAEAEARAILDEAERRALAEELAGKEPAAVEAILRDVPEIERFSVSYRPGWLPDRMPGSAGRIAIEPRE